MIMFCAERMARYNPINISGYHISEAGATSVQEVAFTMANGIAYVEEVTRAGMAVDRFAPRLAFYFVAQQDFMEEVAKFRARRVWAKVMKGRFGAEKAESMRLRFHCQKRQQVRGAGGAVACRDPQGRSCGRGASGRPDQGGACRARLRASDRTARSARQRGPGPRRQPHGDDDRARQGARPWGNYCTFTRGLGPLCRAAGLLTGVTGTNFSQAHIPFTTYRYILFG
jgi:hypothetical protein